MKPRSEQRQNEAYALMIVMFFSAISLMGLGSALKWTSTTARITDRNNNHIATSAAAEAATEKVLASMSRDFQSGGEAAVYSNMATYRTFVPTTAENSYWSRYSFSDAQGNDARTYVNRLSAWTYTNLTSQYEGLKGMASTYRVISNAQLPNVTPPLIAAVRQEVQIASIPIFQFAIFYSMDLEVNPGPNMNVTGRVHSNGNIYNQPQATLNYLTHVTAAGNIVIGKSPLDPTGRTPGTVNFLGENDSGVSSLTLPIGTNNTPSAVRAVVEVPPAGEAAASLMGRQRYYNKADIIVLVSNATVTVRSGSWNNFATSVPWSEASTFISTNVNFYDAREGKTVKTTQIDVGRFGSWSATNVTIRDNLNRNVNSIYVADQRTQTGSTLPGLRLINGATLPTGGLTVATPQPIYVRGHYNAPSADRGTTNTLNTRPASLVGDSITVLSSNWNDANDDSGLSSRLAGHTTVNAAFLAGIVQSNGSSYSGGVENFPRFLENWSNDTFTYNGSMVVMFPSQVATAPWGGSGVYSPPTRNWAFDLNFMDATKLPPGTPQVSTMIRASWASVAPNTYQ